MKNVRAVITRHGDPEVLQLLEEPPPTPGRHEVRLRVRAVGVAFADIYARRGSYPGAPRPPFTPGFDVVGVVDAVGARVRGIELGARVGAFVERGGSARYVCVCAAQLFPVPANVPDELVVAALLNYATALQILVHLGRACSGQTVFAHALAGGVGSAVLDLAPGLGLRVVGTASAAKHAFVRARGGEPIDYRGRDFVTEALAREPAGFAIVLDSMGGPTLCRSHSLVARGGTLISFGFHSAPRDRFAGYLTWARAMGLALAPGRRTRSYRLMSFNRFRRERLHRDVASIMAKLARGELSPALEGVLPLGEIARAHALLEAGATTGKIVLKVDDEGDEAQAPAGCFKEVVA